MITDLFDLFIYYISHMNSLFLVQFGQFLLVFYVWKTLFKW